MRNCTVAACVNSVVGKIHMQCYFNGFVGDQIVQFLTTAINNWSLLVDQETRNSGCVLILDNCPSHREDVLNEACTVSNTFRKLLAHSPLLNIIENVFNVHKIYIKRLHNENRERLMEIDTMQRGEKTRLRLELLHQFCNAGWNLVDNVDIYNAWVSMFGILPMCIGLEDL